MSRRSWCSRPDQRSLGPTTYSGRRWRASPTELRILLIIGNLFVYYSDPQVQLFGRTWQLYDIGFGVGAIGVLLIFCTTAIRHTVQLYNEERLD